MNSTADRETDALIRMTAFEHLRSLQRGRHELSWEEIGRGFYFGKEHLFLANRTRGIFKPKGMRYLLSIKTVVPRTGRRQWYEDAALDSETFEYAFQGSDPNSSDNQLLREAFERQLPIIYFVGVVPARYLPLFPCFIVDWNAIALTARIVFQPLQLEEPAPPASLDERRYGTHLAKRRIHQSTFRQVIFEAYGGRCAFSGLREELLLDAAHIIPDADEELGQPVVQNGIPLTKIHHAAFDQNLIGIDPRYQLHVSKYLRNQRDGPILEALQQLQGQTIHLPKRPEDWPDPERLARRFAEFQRGPRTEVWPMTPAR